MAANSAVTPTRPSRNGPQRGESIRASVSVTFLEAAHGCEKDVTIERSEQCPTCKGNGCAPGTTPEICPDCHGSGMVQVQQRTPMGVFASSRPCQRCHGTGKIIHQPCADCGGSGAVRRRKTIKVTIPAGIVKDAAGSLNESLTLHYEGAWEAPVVKIENITPADGSSMESLTTIDFTFAEKTNLVSSKLSDIKVIKGELVDGEPTGTSVAVEQWWAKNGTTSGTSLGIFAGDEYDGYTKPISLEKDADYYVVLPAGLFRLATSYNTVSDRIILHYTNDKSGAVEIVEADGADTPKEYYTIDGRRVAEPESGRLYIVRQGSKVSKVIVR